MSPAHYHVCRLVLLLDRIPRYGRVHRLRPLPERRYWMFMKRGFWGFYLLDRLNWWDLFELESAYRQALKERHANS